MAAKTCPQFLAAISAAGGAFIVGTLLGWSETARTDVMDGTLGIELTEQEFAWVDFSLALGAACICVPVGFVIHIIGCKLTILVLLIPLLLGWVMLLWSHTVEGMYAGRFLLGMSTGAFCVAVPLYTGEIAQKRIRGLLGSFFHLMLTSGILFVDCIGAVTSVLVMSLICEVLPLIIFIAFFVFMPSSPVYLLKVDDTEEAILSMQFLRGDAFDHTAELNEMKEMDAVLRVEDLPLRDAFTRRASVKGLVIGMGLMFFQQLCGTYAVIFYAKDIFKIAESGLSPIQSTIVIAVVQIMATLLSALVVDKIGRRILLVISGFVMALSTTALGTYFFMKDKDEGSVKSLNWLPVASLCVFIVMFSIGYGPVPWIIIGEVFAPDIKGVAAATVVTLHWILAFVVIVTYSCLKDALGTGQTFWIYSVISLMGVVFVLVLVIETKGKSLTEIHMVLNGLA